MNQRISSKYSFLQIGLLFIVVLFFIIGGFFLPQLGSGKTSSKEWIGAVILIISGIYIVYSFLKTAPFITVDDYFVNFYWLFFRQRSISKDEIEKVEMTGKKDFEILFMVQPQEAASILLKDGSVIIIWDFYYRNMHQIRRALDSFMSPDFLSIKYDNQQKQEVLEITDLNNRLKKYSGNPWTSLNTLMIVGMVIIPLVILWPVYDFRFLAPLLLIFASCLFLFNGSQMYYFLFGDKHLIIKNHYWFWYSRIYKIENIRELVMESPYKRSNGLRIITKDYESKLYCAGSLRDKDWKYFKTHLKRLKIKLRNELHI